jgi:cyclohexanone monooxygenase
MSESVGNSVAKIDKDFLKRKYREERDKRLRSEGNGQYVEIKDQLAHYLEDPYVPITSRDPVMDHVTFTFVGGGFAGLVTGARLVEAGINDVRILEKGGDFGGTWYWNRYPGAQCDTASFVYMPLLEETGHMPTEKYAHGPEILEQCQRIGRQYKLYDGALFHTQVCDVEWQEEKSCWLIKTNRGDEFTSQYIGMGTGPLHVPKLPGLAGIESFKGHSFHTSRWDYDYTGGDSIGASMDKLSDKRVAIIGTGATSVQCIPHLAKACDALYVCQRTPSSVDVRDNLPTDREWFKEIATEGWQKRWLDNFTANQTGGGAEEDLVNDGWTELSRRVREKIMNLAPEDRVPEKMWQAYEDADFEKMSEIRSRIDTIVTEEKTADELKAWYRQLCKRPCFHDEYLNSYNEPGTYLVDTGGKGVELITEKGVVVAGVEYEVDCIIYASGFEVGTPFERRSGFDLTGRDGKTLSEHWNEGMRTLHGLQMHGFPNAFIAQATQGANLISNYPHNLTDAGQTIASIVAHAVSNNFQEIEATHQAEEEWVELLMSGPGLMIGSQDCTPGYYNNEGVDAGPARKSFVGYPAGAVAFFSYIDEWRNTGNFDGVEFRG